MHEFTCKYVHSDHTYIHACMHVIVDTCIYIIHTCSLYIQVIHKTCKCKHTYIHTCMHAYIHTFIHRYIHTHKIQIIHSHMSHTHTNTHKHTQLTLIHSVFMHSCSCTHIDWCIHLHTKTSYMDIERYKKAVFQRQMIHKKDLQAKLKLSILHATLRLRKKIYANTRSRSWSQRIYFSNIFWRRMNNQLRHTNDMHAACIQKQTFLLNKPTIPFTHTHNTRYMYTYMYARDLDIRILAWCPE
jgi:hypothetical protein